MKFHYDINKKAPKDTPADRTTIVSPNVFNRFENRNYIIRSDIQFYGVRSIKIIRRSDRSIRYFELAAEKTPKNNPRLAEEFEW